MVDERRWTLEQLAARSGVSKGMVVQIEQGRTHPSIGTQSKVAELVTEGGKLRPRRVAAIGAKVARALEIPRTNSPAVTPTNPYGLGAPAVPTNLAFVRQAG